MAPKNSPFSIDRKPTTCDIALRRVIIVTKESRITATAMPMALRVAVLASAAIGCARPKANTTTSRPDEHRAGDVEQRLGVPVDLQAADESVQQPRQQHDLERQRQGGGQIQVMLAGAPREQERRHEQQCALYREQVDERHDAPLREHREGQQQQQRRTQVQQLQVEGGSGHGSKLRAAGARGDPAPRRERRSRETPGRETRAAWPKSSR